MKIREEPVDAELLADIEDCASDAAVMLGVERATASADELVVAVDEFVFQIQKGGATLSKDDDPALTLGSLWGQQLVRQFGWQWASVAFEDQGGVSAVGVFSPDRSLATYPFHFIHGCIEEGLEVTILLAFNLLKDETRVPDLPAGGFENVMDNVRHIVPRS